MQCEHCGALACRMDDYFGQEELLPEDFIALIREATALDYNYFILTGGEPFLYKGIWDILDFLRDKGLLFSILTNGSLLDPVVMDRLQGYPQLCYLRISLDYPDQERHDENRKKKFFHALPAIMQQLSARQIPFGIGTTLFPENLADVEAISARIYSG